MTSKQVIIYIDDFNIMSNHNVKILNDLKYLMNTYNYDNCFIYIETDNRTIFDFDYKKTILNKLIPDNFKHDILQTDTFKIIKPIKKILADGYEIPFIICSPENREYMSNALKGLPVKIYAYDKKNSDDEIINIINDDDYAKYIKMVPQELWSEFQIIRNKLLSLNEENGMKLTKKQLDAHIAGLIDEVVVELTEKVINNNLKKKTMKYTVNASTDNMIKKMIYEKLTGKSYDKMYELKSKTYKRLKKIVKNNWINVVETIESKQAGNFKMKLIGAGNTSIFLVWGNQFDGKFTILNKTAIVAGNEYSNKIQKFIMGLLDNTDAVMEILNSVGAIAETMRIDNEIDNDEDDDMSIIDEPVENNLLKSIVNEPMGEPTDEPIEEPTEEPTEEPMGEPEPIEEPTEEPMVEPTEEPMGEDDEKDDEEKMVK